MTAPKPLRCAIYTRKSSEEGLKQEFNSLDAQREACAAYVLSQAGEGWTALATVYDDGGFSGGNMERPALKALLADIDRGLVDVVVVYKVDRLTRSLTDFGKIVEQFDGKGVSFVSVTQAFNTTTSMGRLTLNVLLSFAQFEREVTGERIRDKIAASKAKGLWMGGNVPIGYDADGRTLKICEYEAATVRHIYRRYLELGSVHRLREELETQGVRSKLRTSLEGKIRGGAPLNRGALFHVLSNRVYLGQVPHKGVFHPGQHPPLIDQELFEAVQAKLVQTAHPQRRAKAGLEPLAPAAPLAGLIRDDRGNLMSPVTAKGAAGQRYRYYVSSPLQLGRSGEAGSVTRVPAPVLEALVLEHSQRLGVVGSVDRPWTNLREALMSVEVARRRVRITFRLDRLPVEAHPADAGGAVLTIAGGLAVLTIAAAVKSRGGSRVIIGPQGRSAVSTIERDTTLIKALARAEAWRRTLVAGRVPTLAAIGKDEGLAQTYIQRVVRLAFLAPDLKRSILDGRQPAGLTLERFMKNELPLDWAGQRRLFSV